MFRNESSEAKAFLDDDSGDEEEEYKAGLKASLDMAALQSLTSSRTIISSGKKRTCTNCPASQLYSSLDKDSLEDPPSRAKRKRKRALKELAITSPSLSSADHDPQNVNERHIHHDSHGRDGIFVTKAKTEAKTRTKLNNSSITSYLGASTEQSTTPDATSASLSPLEIKAHVMSTSHRAAASDSLQCLTTTSTSIATNSHSKKEKNASTGSQITCTSSRVTKRPEGVEKYTYLIGTRHDDPDEPNALFETTRVLSENAMIVAYRKRVLRSGVLAKAEAPYCLHVAAVASMTKEYEKKQKLLAEMSMMKPTFISP